MSEPGFKHVLFKDLSHYLRITDYLSGYTPFEQALVRKNIGAISLKDIKTGGKDLEYKELESLIKSKQLIPGMLYIINGFCTIYQSYDGKTYGLDNNPSNPYTLVAIAVTEDKLSPRVTVISDDPQSIYWTVIYDPTSEILSDGQSTMGKILYMEDENFNKATYDFKNILWKKGYTFQKDGKENSKECYGNDLCFTDNITIKVPVSNLFSRISDVDIDVNLDLSTPYQKQIIKMEDNVYIDYLDLETLTHQFYALANDSRIHE